MLLYKLQLYLRTAGNDFLPNLPSLEIYDRPSALDTLLKTYRDLLPSMGGYLTKGGTINPDRLRRLLTKLAEDEEPAFQRRQLKAAAELRRKMARESEDAGRQAASNGFQGPDATGQWVSLGELAADADLDALLGQAPDEGNVPRIDLTTARPSELRREVLRRVNERLNAKLMGSAAADPVRLALQGYRARHYEIRFGASPGEGVEKMARKVSQAYVQGLAWVIAYYCQGNTPVFTTDAVRQAQRSTAGKARWQKGEDGTAGAAWDWFYPYYYAPLVSDLCRNTGALSKIKWSTGKSGLEDSAGESWADGHGPVRPLVQLMAVLPPQSAAQCLPRKLASLLVATQEVEGSSQLTNASMAAALADMFPRHIEPLIDMAGKKWAHTAVVKLPFADVKRLAGAAQMDAPDEQELTPDEEERNTFRSAVLMMVAEHPEADTAQALAADHNGGGASAGGSSVLSLVVPGSVDAVASDDQSVVSVALDTAGMPAQPFAPSLLPGVEVGRAVVDCRVWAKRRMEAQRRQLAWAGQGGARGSRGGRGGGRQGRGAGRGRR
ncbi:hypothetical protein WJX72_003960 [[Myrmecia] bisecta]|uniref:Xrn1 helical domain-containing protein n=1 Tax=[Myrmecia] bisecta TaxID=41462 RepID=A0AAW1QR68_9CHLO